MAIRGKIKGKKRAKKPMAPPVLRHPDVHLAIEYVDVADLVPYVNNARTHPDDQIAQLVASIAKLGFNDPIAVDGARGIVEGHARVMAAQKLKIKQVPVISLTHLTDAQKRAYVLAHNKIALNANWDREKLSAELASIKELEAIDGASPAELTGFGDREIRALTTAEEKGNGEGYGGGTAGDDADFLLLITCDTNADRQKLLERLEREGYDCEIVEG